MEKKVITTLSRVFQGNNSRKGEPTKLNEKLTARNKKSIKKLIRLLVSVAVVTLTILLSWLLSWLLEGVPGCWPVVMSGDIRDCTCHREPQTFAAFERQEFNGEIKRLKAKIKELEDENEYYRKVLENNEIEL